MEVRNQPLVQPGQNTRQDASSVREAKQGNGQKRPIRLLFAKLLNQVYWIFRLEFLPDQSLQTEQYNQNHRELRESRKCGYGFLGTVLVIARHQDQVLALPRTIAPFVNNTLSKDRCANCAQHYKKKREGGIDSHIQFVKEISSVQRAKICPTKKPERIEFLFLKGKDSGLTKNPKL